ASPPARGAADTVSLAAMSEGSATAAKVHKADTEVEWPSTRVGGRRDSALSGAVFVGSRGGRHKIALFHRAAWDIGGTFAHYRSTPPGWRMMISGRPRVYIIDDDESVRRSLHRLVRCAGYEVDALATSEAYLALTAPARSACLVVDMRMPGMSGLDLQRI